MRDYLASSPAAGWNRKPGVRVLWNNVTEANNHALVSSSTQLTFTSTVFSTSWPPTLTSTTTSTTWVPPTPTKECSGLAANKYVARETLRSLIEDAFCPEAVKQGGLDPGSSAIMRRYNEGTPEDVTLAIEYKPGVKFKPDLTGCVGSLLGDLTDGCDPPNDEENPANWKGGGLLTVGNVAYRIVPQSKRQLHEWKVEGGCMEWYNVVFEEYWMWGHGFASSDHGAGVKAQLQGCALLPDTWDFRYELGEDHREWTAKFRTGVGQRSCVNHAVVTAGAPGDFNCDQR